MLFHGVSKLLNGVGFIEEMLQGLVIYAGMLDKVLGKTIDEKSRRRASEHDVHWPFDYSILVVAWRSRAVQH